DGFQQALLGDFIPVRNQDVLVPALTHLGKRGTAMQRLIRPIAENDLVSGGFDDPYRRLIVALASVPASLADQAGDSSEFLDSVDRGSKKPMIRMETKTAWKLHSSVFSV